MRDCEFEYNGRRIYSLNLPHHPKKPPEVCIYHTVHNNNNNKNNKNIVNLS